ncbi:MAG: hypothetical protein LBT47_13605 [Deltaproteobacteria bacterium]|nr:hypothetical protein [Deltaproteobacteria bacterium]
MSGCIRCYTHEVKHWPALSWGDESLNTFKPSPRKGFRGLSTQPGTSLGGRPRPFLGQHLGELA